MIEFLAIGAMVALGLAAIACVVMALVIKGQTSETRDARLGELNATKAKTAAQNEATAAKARASTAEDVARKALAALKVYEASTPTPETDRVTTDPDRRVSHRADELERLLNS